MSLAGNLRSHRRRAGLSQEQLAEQSGISVSVIRKIEQGGSARTETYHALARALDVNTSDLFAATPPEAVPTVEGDSIRLMGLRAALMPPIGLNGLVPAAAPAPVDLAELRSRIATSQTLFHGDRYGAVAKTLPGILGDAEAAVAGAEEVDTVRAVMARTSALLLTGKYLTQVRRYDLAYLALSRAIADARQIDAEALAATGIVGLTWLLLRQDRFVEAEELAAATAAQVEPRMSSATPGQLALWGELCQRIASAAIRNNRPETAREARRLTATAASALHREHTSYSAHWDTFGPVTAEMKAIEDLSLVGDAHGVLRRADDGAVGPKALKRVGQPAAIDWWRHRLDVARAHTLLGSHQDAMDELGAIMAGAPSWMQHQKMAGYILADILGNRKRTLTTDMRAMALHLGITG